MVSYLNIGLANGTITQLQKLWILYTGGGTFSKVWGEEQAHAKKAIENFVV